MSVCVLGYERRRPGQAARDAGEKKSLRDRGIGVRKQTDLYSRFLRRYYDDKKRREKRIELKETYVTYVLFNVDEFQPRKSGCKKSKFLFWVLSRVKILLLSVFFPPLVSFDLS